MVVIRVVYRWRVDSGRREAFAKWWHDGTLTIRETRQGALGSTLLAPEKDPSHMVAIARWESKADLQAFWAEPRGTGFDGAELVSAEVFEEVDDLTAK